MYFVSGRITFPQIAKSENWGSNPGLVTVTALSTQIVAVALGPVRIDDRVFMTANMLGIKQAIQGDFELRALHVGGGAEMIQLDTFVTSRHRMLDVNPFHAVRIMFSTVGRVTLAGNLSVQIKGVSVASNTTIAANQGQLYAYVIAGS